MKVTQKLHQFTHRYLNKSTIAAKYDKCMDVATTTGFLTGMEFLRFGSWEMADVGITAALSTVFLTKAVKAIKNRIALQPIRNRAIQIKKASENFRHLYRNA